MTILVFQVMIILLSGFSLLLLLLSALVHVLYLAVKEVEYLGVAVTNNFVELGLHLTSILLV